MRAARAAVRQPFQAVIVVFGGQGAGRGAATRVPLPARKQGGRAAIIPAIRDILTEPRHARSRNHKNSLKGMDQEQTPHCRLG